MLIKNFNRKVSSIAGKVSLQNVLVVAFVTQVFAAVGLTGWLSFHNGRQAVNEIATELRNEINDEIKHYLEDYLEEPHRINRINAQAISLGYLNVNDLKSVERYLWNQMQLFDSVSYIQYASPRQYKVGQFRGVYRETSGSPILLEATDRQRDNSLYIYATDNQGNRTKLVQTLPNYDLRTRPWYINAVQAGKPSWSPLYSSYKRPEIVSITATSPIYDDDGSLLGILGTDLSISEITNFLRNQKISKNGESFIVEPSGLLVATSTTEQSFTVSNGESKRLKALDSSEPLVRFTAKHLIETFGNLNKIQTSQNLSFKINGQRQFLQVVPYQDRLGLNWLTVVVVPEADFMGRIEENRRTTILLCIVALAVATLLGIRTSRWIVRPILRLNTAAKKLSDGEWDQKLPVQRSDELGELAKSFNTMAANLQESFAILAARNADLLQAKQELAEYNQTLEEKVEQRTAELATSLRQIETYSQALDKELQQGRQIQRAFLPEQLPQIPSWEIAAFFKPARQVAGDFYDAFPLPGNCVGLVIADVCDKGVGAALFMALFRSLIRLFASQTCLDGIASPDKEVLSKSLNSMNNESTINLVQIDALKAVSLTNNFIALNQGDMSMFATLFFGVLDPATGLLTYINGGHEPLFIINSSGGVREYLNPTGPAVGMMANMNFKINHTYLEAGESVLGYTDGVPEAHAPGGHFFTKERLLSMLEHPAPTAQALVDEIAASVLAHTGKADQFDDITMIALRRSPMPDLNPN
ncbi:MAG: SpoIIE family protein phosphatase [Aphanothece sp. CMT-3BRIN-NPC111]|jgi:serine phosphatase RsbU (regulator of sigma subunit)|nr:SpoIIE family protein phosphatase [Aphanothece sp. CMT-3BRIN-NPC111]